MGVACLRPWLYATGCEGKKVEAEKPVPHVGTFWGEWSQWSNRLPQAWRGGSSCEARIAEGLGGLRNP